METITKSFAFHEGKLVPSLDLFLLESGWSSDRSILSKSASSKSSEYKVYVRSYTSQYKYKLRNFALNEMEAEFDSDTGEIRSLVFRDTSVHKKITFNEKSAIITVVRGSDAVGNKTEAITTTLKEPIIGISVNGNELKAPFDLGEVYTEFTGLDSAYLTEEEIEEEKVNATLWAELAEQLQQGTN